MARRNANKPDKVEALKEVPQRIIEKEMRGLPWVIFLTLVLMFGMYGGAYYYLVIEEGNGPLTPDPQIDQLVLLSILVLTFIVLWATVGMSASNRRRRMIMKLDKAVQEEYGALRVANKQAKALQQMANTLRTTLNMNRVMESALQVCTLGLQEVGIHENNVVSAVLLYGGENNSELRIEIEQRMPHDLDVFIDDQIGAIGSARANAEPIIVDDIEGDLNLSRFTALKKCKTAVCIPLRVGFDMYGILLIGLEVKFQFDDDSMQLFSAVADQAVIALRNAQLYEDLEREKERLIAAESEARKELARDLHDGPTQNVSAIAMRINFVRSLMKQNPQEAMEELSKIEKLANDTAKIIRGMLFTLRPLVLETQGLGAAIETVMERIEENEGIKTRLVGDEHGELLNQRAQGVLFYIIEEALGNAKKYSQAGNIEVRFWKEDDLFVARVNDDGAGFDVDDVMGDYASRGSLGMVNMRERADMIDGFVKVDSSPGQGTSITVGVPLNKQGQTNK